MLSFWFVVSSMDLNIFSSLGIIFCIRCPLSIKKYLKVLCHFFTFSLLFDTFSFISRNVLAQARHTLPLYNLSGYPHHSRLTVLKHSSTVAHILENFRIFENIPEHSSTFENILDHPRTCNYPLVTLIFDMIASDKIQQKKTSKMGFRAAELY